MPRPIPAVLPTPRALSLRAAGLLLALAACGPACGSPFAPPETCAALRPVIKTATLPYDDDFPPSIEHEAPVASPFRGPDVFRDHGPPLVTPDDSVVRAQSPEIDLIPLASGEAEVEQTSLLTAITGTSGRLRFDYLTDLGRTTKFGANVITSTWIGLGLDAEANYWQRPVAGLGREPLWVGDLNVIYSFPLHPRMKVRSGAGTAWRIDRGNAGVGYNLSTAADVYLLWRFMATGEIDYGKIESDRLLRYRLALGLTWGPAEFFTGYESLRLGPERLDGWINGISVWY